MSELPVTETMPLPLKMAPPEDVAELSENVLSAIISELPPFKIAPPELAMLPENVLFVTVTVDVECVIDRGSVGFVLLHPVEDRFVSREIIVEAVLLSRAAVQHRKAAGPGHVKDCRIAML